MYCQRPNGTLNLSQIDEIGLFEISLCRRAFRVNMYSTSQSKLLLVGYLNIKTFVIGTINSFVLFERSPIESSTLEMVVFLARSFFSSIFNMAATNGGSFLVANGTFQFGSSAESLANILQGSIDFFINFRRPKGTVDMHPFTVADVQQPSSLAASMLTT